jgi:HK97 family phage portal protein
MRSTTPGALLSSQFLAQRHWGVQPQKTSATLFEAYKSWVYSCVNKIAYKIAGAKINLYYWDGDEKVYVEKHPFLDLLNRPNPFTTRREYLFQFMCRMELIGKTFSYMPRNGLGLPAEMWLLPLSRNGEVRILPSSQTFIDGYLYNEGNVRVKFEQEEIFWVKYLNPGDPFDGYSPLMGQDYPYDIDHFLSQQQYAFFKNSAMPGAVFSTDQTLDEETVKRIRDEFDQQYAGASRHGMSMFTHGGFEPKKAALTPKEFQIGTVADWNRDKMIAAYGLSAGKLGIVKDVNRANGEFLDYQFITDCIHPRLDLILEKLEVDILSQYDESLHLEHDVPAPTDRELDIKERESMWRSGALTQDEWRQEMGLDALPDEMGSRTWVPINVVPMEPAEPEEEEPQQPPPGEQPAEEPEEEEQSMDMLCASTEEEAEAMAHTLAWKAFVTKTDAWEKKWIPTLRRLFNEQRAEVQRNLKKHGPKRIEEGRYCPPAKEGAGQHGQYPF